MPALVLCGRSFLLAADDFWSFVWVFVPVHIMWAIIDATPTMCKAMPVIHVPQVIVALDAAVCWVTVPIDIGIVICSADGPIMQPRRCERLFKCLLLLRVGLTLLLISLSACIWVPALIHVAQSLMAGQFNLATLALQATSSVSATTWDVTWLWLSLVTRIIIFMNVINTSVLLLLPKDMQGYLIGESAYLSIRLLGGGSKLYGSITKLIMQNVVGDLTINQVTPTDMLYGLILVSTMQKQGEIGSNLDDRDVPLEEETARLLAEGKVTECKLPPSIVRATTLQGLHRPLTPFSPTDAHDQAALHEIMHLAPFASGIYGPLLFGLPARGFEPGTMYPANACCAVCSALPCWQQLRPGSSTGECARRRCCCFSCCFCCCNSTVTEGDWPCGLNEDFLLKSVLSPARQEGSIEPELLWASWKNYGPEKALPMGVLLDHAHQRVVITIRGTADLKDCINDLGIIPTFFDPLGLAQHDSNKQPPFDAERDFFVPEVWLSIAKDAKQLLQDRGVLQKALHPEGPSAKYQLQITGHSLGAAVACLLALLLHAEYPGRVHFLGFEPPGCVLSKRLAKETQKLGWLSSVCAHDWVPRLSIKNAQRVCDRAFDELEACDRSKFQLACLFVSGLLRNAWCFGCLRHCLAAPFLCLAGGPLGPTQSSLHAFFRYKHLGGKLEVARHGTSFPDMCPPGDIAYFRPLASEWRCMCGVVIEKDVEWCAEWADPDDIQQEFVVSERIIDLHVPWVYEHAFGCVHDRFSRAPQAPRPRLFSQSRHGGRRGEL